jgi:hypothetical protein
MDIFTAPNDFDPSDTSRMLNAVLPGPARHRRQSYQLSDLKKLGVEMSPCRRCSLGVVFPPKRTSSGFGGTHVCYRRSTEIAVYQLLKLHRHVQQCVWCGDVFMSLGKFNYCGQACYESCRAWAGGSGGSTSTTTTTTSANKCEDTGKDQCVQFEEFDASDQCDWSDWPALASTQEPSQPNQLTAPVPVGRSTYLQVAMSAPGSLANATIQTNVTSVTSTPAVVVQTPVPVQNPTQPAIPVTPVTPAGATNMADTQAIDQLLSSARDDYSDYGSIGNTPIHCDRCMEPIYGQMHLLTETVPTNALTYPQYMLSGNFIICSSCCNFLIRANSNGRCQTCTRPVGCARTFWRDYTFCNYQCQHTYAIGQILSNKQ